MDGKPDICPKNEQWTKMYTQKMCLPSTVGERLIVMYGLLVSKKFMKLHGSTVETEKFL